MVKHIILWQLNDDIPENKKEIVKKAAKEGLEGLKGRVEGLVDIKVNIKPLETSNVDMMLDATLEDFDALKAYAVNKYHVAVADSKIRPYTKTRSCIDFEI